MNPQIVETFEMQSMENSLTSLTYLDQILNQFHREAPEMKLIASSLQGDKHQSRNQPLNYIPTNTVYLAKEAPSIR